MKSNGLLMIVNKLFEREFEFLIQHEKYRYLTVYYHDEEEEPNDFCLFLQYKGIKLHRYDKCVVIDEKLKVDNLEEIHDKLQNVSIQNELKGLFVDKVLSGFFESKGYILILPGCIPILKEQLEKVDKYLVIDTGLYEESWYEGCRFERISVRLNDFKKYLDDMYSLFKLEYGY